MRRKSLSLQITFPIKLYDNTYFNFSLIFNFVLPNRGRSYGGLNLGKGWSMLFISNHNHFKLWNRSKVTLPFLEKRYKQHITEQQVWQQVLHVIKMLSYKCDKSVCLTEPKQMIKKNKIKIPHITLLQQILNMSHVD